MDTLSIFVNTHSSCYDLWPAFFGRIAKHFPSRPAMIVAVDDPAPDEYHGYAWRPVMKKDDKLYYYDPSKSFGQQYIDGLSHVTSDFTLPLLDDMILYADVDMDRLERSIERLEKSTVPCIRLILSGFGPLMPLGDGYFETLPPYFQVYSMQAAVWRTDALRKVVSQALDCRTPWEFETHANHAMKSMPGMEKILVSYRGEPKRGRNHCDSSEMPYCSTALVRGKWNREYEAELASVFSEYQIDPHFRGFV